MSRVLGLIVVGCIAVGLTGCVGPMGAGCCGPTSGPVACDGGCGDSGCSSCNSCTGCGELYIDPWINHPADCVDPCDSCGNYNGQSCGKCRSIFAGAKSLWGYHCGCDPAPVKLSDRCFAPRCTAGCSGCDSCMPEPACGCEGACDCGISEPACGCEGACTCGGGEPACGCEGACDCGGIEPGCGLEPACGCEGGCNCGTTSFASPHAAGTTAAIPYGTSTGEYIIESPGNTYPTIVEQPYKPRRTRKIFNPRPSTANGFLNDYHR